MKTFVMIPTYNEADNLRKLIPAIFKTVPEANLLVVDDKSPDGTAKVVKSMQKKYPKKISLIVRKDERGRGSAGIDGFKAALKKGADVVVEMDADFSHHPKYLPSMINALSDADVVVGSRFVKGGKDERGLIRTLITIMGAMYIRFVLGIKLKDPTSGYRMFKKNALLEIDMDNLISVKTWAVVQEMLYKAALADLKVREVPIEFVDRESGDSKFNLKILMQGILLVLVLKLEHSSIWKHDPLRK